jgi:hypothetical protein
MYVAAVRVRVMAECSVFGPQTRALSSFTVNAVPPLTMSAGVQSRRIVSNPAPHVAIVTDIVYGIVRR